MTKQKPLKDITDERFDRLIARYPTDKRSHNGSVFWYCDCDCGGHTLASQDDLAHGNVKSCGCLRRKWAKELPNRLHKIDGTCIEMLEKRHSRSDNTSGVYGVSKMANGRFRATITFAKTRIYLGTRDTLEEAATLRKQAEIDIHQNYLAHRKAYDERAEKDPEWAEKNPFSFKLIKENHGNYRIRKTPEL